LRSPHRPTDQPTTIDSGRLRSVSPTGHEPFVALQEPPAELAWPCTLYVPDIESPETDPEYVIACEPTVPKLIVSPFTVPLISRLPDPEDSLIVPLRFDPDCCQSRTNVPWKVPSYCPDHVPESPPVSAAALVAAGAVDVGGALWTTWSLSRSTSCCRRRARGRAPPRAR
jgi:hypothetical protein